MQTVLSKKAKYFENGFYCKAINPTPGTGIAQTIQTSFLATNGVLSVRNSHASQYIFMDYIRLITTAVGASMTRSEGLIVVDGITRYSSGGSPITAVPISQRVQSMGFTSAAVIHFGALTLAAESGAKLRISRFQLRTAIQVQYEETVLKFDSMGSSNDQMGGTNALRQIINVGPAVITPSDTLTLHIWNPGNAVTPPSYEFEIGWIER